MNRIESWKLSEYRFQFLCEGLLCVLDFSGIECSDARNFKAWSNDGGKSSLGTTEDNIEKICASRNRLDVLEGRRRLIHLVGLFFAPEKLSPEKKEKRNFDQH